MEQGRFLLDRLDAKINLLTTLKTLLETQQVLLIENRLGDLEACSSKLLQCMEALQQWESRWQEAIATLRQQPRLVDLSNRDLLFVVVDNADHPRLLRTLDTLHRLGQTIVQLRENNHQLMENSLAFVRSMVRAFQSGGQPQAVYRPHKPLAARSALVNRKL
ncbi:MAG: hypothetical protein D6715_11700 [Calditrichaeota bacterium]|nr:MAG: hypothetical protein D6715_11700 [Calditrichota bacterium]